ncbi:RapZ C-terminal domain-containing protein [Streptomyces sp. SGAir0957]
MGSGDRVDIHVLCGGGRHRSVAVAEELATRLAHARDVAGRGAPRSSAPAGRAKRLPLAVQPRYGDRPVGGGSGAVP